MQREPLVLRMGIKLNKARFGLWLMALASFAYIFGALWYFILCPSGLANPIVQLFFGSLIGVPTAGLTLLAKRYPKTGGRIATLIALVAISVLLYRWIIFTTQPESPLTMPGSGCLEEAFPRLIWSLFGITIVYLAGALMVFFSERQKEQ